MPFTQSHGQKIQFTVSGVGSPLVLHAGMFQDGAHWTHSGYLPTLLDAHMVITIDPLGLGASDAPREIDAYALQRRVDYVVAVLDEVGVDHADYWGYSLGAMTGYAVAVHAPERLNRLVAGAFDPVGGFRSAVDKAIEALGLPGDVDAYEIMKAGAYSDPYQAALIDAGDPAAFRANYDAFSRLPGFHVDLAACNIPTLMYAGTADPWHEPMRTFAERAGMRFLSIPDADHKGGWDRAADVLPSVMAFLAADD